MLVLKDVQEMSNSFKPFFIHYNRPARKGDRSKLRHSPRGFTAYIQPSELPRHVQVQVAFCSTQDEFSKKEGRSFAVKAEIAAINARTIPTLLAACRAACEGQKAHDESAYHYVLKYVV